MKNLSASINLLIVFAIFMTTIVPANVEAITTAEYKMEMSNENQIEKAFNKFRYDMTVDWDQKDPYFKDYAQKELENSLLALSSKGVTVEEIQSYMEKNILDAKSKNEYSRLLATLKKQNLSEEDASAAAMKFMEKNYQQGASFQSGASVAYKKVLIVVGVVIVGVVTYLLIKKCKKPSDNGTTSTDSTSSVTDSSTSSESESAQSSSTSSESSTGGYSESSASETSSQESSQSSSSQGTTGCYGSYECWDY